MPNEVFGSFDAFLNSTPATATPASGGSGGAAPAPAPAPAPGTQTPEPAKGGTTPAPAPAPTQDKPATQTTQTPAPELEKAGPNQLFHALSKRFETQKPAATTTPTTTGQTPAPGQPAPSADFVDLNGLDPADVEMLKQMSTPARQRYAKLARQIADGSYLPAETVAKRLEAARAEASQNRAISHEYGYILDPAYIKANTEAVNIDRMIGGYSNALRSIAAGKNFRIPVKDAQGNISESTQEYQPTPEATVDLQQALMQLHVQKNASQSVMQGIEDRHKTLAGQHANTLDATYNELFGSYSQNQAFNAAVEHLLTQLPPSLQAIPEKRLLAAGQAVLYASEAHRTELLNEVAALKAQLAGGGRSTVPENKVVTAYPESKDRKDILKEFADLGI